MKMNKAIILPGMPSKENYYDPSRYSQSNEHWIPWLQHQLLLKDILTQTPEWPKPYDPNYEDWLEVFHQFEIDENTILIGHSGGASFLIRWLSENEVKVGKVILVAPWTDPEKELKNNDFFDFKIDPKLASKTKELIIFGSNNDEKDIQLSIKQLLAEVRDVKYKNFDGYGHFTFNDMKKREFPELLQEVLKETNA